MKEKINLSNGKELKQWQIIFGDLVKYIENGKGKILGRFYGVISFVLLAGIYLNVSGEQFTPFEIVAYSFWLLVVLTFLGWVYSKGGFLEAEQSRLNEESPQIMEILKNSRELLKELKQLKQV